MTKNILLTEIKRNDMVSNREIKPLLGIVWNLATVCSRADQATGLATVNIKVKGDVGIIAYLQRILESAELPSRKHVEIEKVSYEVQSWIDLLDKEYGDPETLIQTKSVQLVRKHASKLATAAFLWYSKIASIYEKPNTKFINEDELRASVKELSKILDAESKKDLDDGYECIVNNIPTPGAMILYRVGESMVRKFYSKEMGHDTPEGSTMGSMAKELREKQVKEIEQKTRTKPDPLVNYILSQMDERNLAQHPERRFDQQEVEEVFIFVKKLINDIHERLEK